MLAPICLFTYNRVEETKKTVSALQANFLAKDSDLIIFSDAAKNEKSQLLVDEVREYIKTIGGFRSLKIIQAEKNKGLAKSIIDGVTLIINEYGRVIVLEDDLITSRNFLDFMNQALDFYEQNESIYSIAGYTPSIKKWRQDVYYTKRASSWGWGTWKYQWGGINWDVNSLRDVISDITFARNFNKMGSDMAKMLNDQVQGKINSWAIRWCLHQFLSDKYSVYPTISKVINIGTSSSATHTKDRFNRFYTEIDSGENRMFDFNVLVKLDKFYLKQFLKQFSIYTRVKYKVLNFLVR